MTSDEVWHRIEQHAGSDFQTVTGISFSYSTRPRTIKLTNTNRSISRTQVDRALKRWPVAGPGQLGDLQGPAYLYAILADGRVLGRS